MQTLAKMSEALDRAVTWRILVAPALARVSRWAAAALFLASFLVPTGRFGPDLCPLHRTTGLPCHGCGVTRGLISFSHGDFSEAVGANPWVLVLWPVLAVLALSALMPASKLSAFEAFIARSEPWPSRITRVLVIAFFGFGTLRLVYFLVSGDEFP